MKPILIAGTTIVNLALISYSVAVFYQNKSKILSKKVMTFLSMGVIFDITATICMVLGSSKGGLTVHGFIGYSSLLGMLIDYYFSIRKINAEGIGVSLSSTFNRNTKIAYFYWVAAYITGAMIVAMR